MHYVQQKSKYDFVALSATKPAHVLIGKYADHTPLYRQSEIYAREGIELNAHCLHNGSAERVDYSRRSLTLTLERDILSKAAAWFAWEIKLRPVNAYEAHAFVQ